MLQAQGLPTTLEYGARFTSSSARARTDERRMMMCLFASALAVLLLMHNGLLTGLDGQTSYEVAKSVIDHHRPDVGAGFNTVKGIGGHEYGKANLGLPLLAGIVYFLTTPVTWFAQRHADLIRTALIGASMTPILAALLVAMYRLARTLGARPSSALLVGTGTILGTYLLPYSKEFFPEPLAALGIVWASERALANRPAAAGTALAVALLARAQSVLLIPAFVVIILRRGGVSAGIKAAAPVCVGVLLTAAYNLARFGDLLSFGYQDEGFTMPFLRGAHMLLFTPSKSVILFAPVILLLPWALVRLWRRDKPALLLIGSTLAITFGVTAVWHNPNGGWCWGPRLLIPGLVPALATLGPWLDRSRHRNIALGLLILGFAVSAPALIVSTQAQQLDVPPPPGGVWQADMGLPRIGRQAQLVPVTIAYTLTHVYERREDGQNYLRYLTLWQLGAARVFGPAGLIAGMIASLALVVFAMLAAQRCRLAYDELCRTEKAAGI